MPVFVDGEGLNISSLNEKVLDLEGKIPLMEERIRDLENQLNSSENFFLSEGVVKILWKLSSG